MAEKKDPVDKTLDGVAGAAGGGVLGFTLGASIVGTALTALGVATAPAWVPAALGVGGAYMGYKWMKGK